MPLEALVITFREGLEAALMVGLMLAYLAKTGKEKLDKWIYLGIIAGIGASLGEAVLIQSLFNGAETAQQSIISGTTMVIASILVVTLILWMMKSARTIRKATESKMDQYLRGGSTFGIFLLSFAFIFREGSETVLFLYSLILTSDAASQIITGLFGLVFAVGWGVLIIKGAIRVDLKKFFTVTSILISIFAIEMIASAIHEFQEARVLGSAGTGLLWDFQVWLVTDSAKLLTMLPIVIVPLSLVLFSKVENVADLGRDVVRAKATLVGVRLGAIVMATAVMLLFAQAVAAQTPVYDPQPMHVTAENGRVMLNVTAYNLTDGMLHKFQLSLNGRNIRFMVIADGNGGLRTAFDSCKVCGSMGFVQTGPEAIACKRCGVETEVGDIGIDIACHPIPLDSTLAGQVLTIGEASLLSGLSYF